MSKELFTVAEKIKRLRELSGQTQSELARILGLSRSGVNAWEMGLSIPSTQYIVELAKHFKVSTDFLLGMDETATISVQGLSKEQVSAVLAVIQCFQRNKSDEE